MLEAAIISQDRHRLNHLAGRGVPSAVIMRKLLANIDELLAAILLCTNLANVVRATTGRCLWQNSAAAAIMPARIHSGGYAVLVVIDRNTGGG